MLLLSMFENLKQFYPVYTGLHKIANIFSDINKIKMQTPDPAKYFEGPTPLTPGCRIFPFHCTPQCYNFPSAGSETGSHIEKMRPVCMQKNPDFSNPCWYRFPAVLDNFLSIPRSCQKYGFFLHPVHDQTASIHFHDWSVLRYFLYTPAVFLYPRLSLSHGYRTLSHSDNGLH